MAFLKSNFLRLYSRIFSKPFFHGFNLFLFDLSVRGLGIYSHNSGERYFYSKILPKIIQNNKPVLFDIGSNIGINTILLNQFIPKARIFSFEPNPKCYKKLKEIETNNILIFNLGLGEKTKKIKLFDKNVLKLTQHSSLYKEVITDLHGSDINEFEIEITTIDDICEKNNLKYIDFIKIDTEGNELDVIKGAKNLLSNKSIGCIQFEFNTMNVISRVFFRDFIQLLNDYTLYRMLPKGLIKLNSNILHTEIYGLQNIIAILNDKII